MFERIAGSGRLFGRSREDGAGVSLNIEVFFLENDSWSAIDEVRTERDGAFKFEVRVDGFDRVPVAPFLRLVDQGSERVLPSVTDLRLQREVLLVDFGDVGQARGGDSAEDLRDLQKQLDEANRTIRDLRAQQESGAPDTVTSDGIKRLTLDLIGKETELKEAMKRLEMSETRAAEAAQERDTLQLELDQIRSADTASPLITDLAGSVARSLGAAAKPQVGQGFKLADAEIKLKGFLADGGARFKPLDAAEIVRANAAGASEISFRLTPDTDSSGDGTKMPDVIGLTPASGRRILRPLGQPIQVVEAPGTPAGAIVKQVPDAGAVLDPEATIRLVVATGEGEDA